MAYVILVNNDDTLYGSHKERIMQRQKLVNSLVFVVDPIYHGIDMTNATVMLEYVLPVSREYKTVLLTLSEERYNDCFLQYKLPFDTGLTAQSGNLELQLTFAYVEMTPEGKGIQRVRKTSSTTIEILPITAWSDIVPDSALSALDDRLIKMDAQMRAMNDYLDAIDGINPVNQVDNLVYNAEEETLQLSANGVGVGDKVSVRDMIDDGIPVVDLKGGSEDIPSNPETDDNDGCNCDNCDCENNVVVFGQTEAPIQPENENNVVEF